jgi:hypothetical protein
MKDISKLKYTINLMLFRIALKKKIHITEYFFYLPTAIIVSYCNFLSLSITMDPLVGKRINISTQVTSAINIINIIHVAKPINNL